MLIYIHTERNRSPCIDPKRMEASTMAQSVIGGILLSIIGLLLLLNPHGVWKATERWKLMGAAEASPAFITITRILGAVLLVFGCLVCFGILT